MRPVIRALSLAVLFLASCGPAGNEPDAGPPTLVLTEALRIDGAAADLVPIGAWGGVVEFGDGSIAVGQRQDSRVLYLRADGVRLDSVGRPGSGPGEFSMLGPMGRVADSLWVFDGMERRITLFGPDRALVRTISVPAEVAPEAGGKGLTWSFLGPRSLRPDGGFLATAQQAVTEYQPDDPVVTMILVTPTPAYERVIAQLVNGRDLRVLRSATGGSMSADLLPITPLYAVSPDGQFVVLVRMVLEGEGAGSFSATLLRAEGDTVASRSHSFEPTPVPPAWADSVLEARIARSSPEFADLLRRNARFPPVFPPFSQVVVGEDGVIWLEERVGPTGMRTALVLDRDATILGRVTWPSNSMATLVRRSEVWALERDPDGVQSLVKYRVN